MNDHLHTTGCGCREVLETQPGYVDTPTACTCGVSMRPGAYDPNCPIDGEVTEEDHGPGCDGPLNCTCPVPTTYDLLTDHVVRVRELSSRATNYYVGMAPGPMKPRALFIAQAAVRMRMAAEARWVAQAFDSAGNFNTAPVLP